MELDIRAGKRVLYKKNGSSWLVGEIGGGNASITENGLYLPIWTKNTKNDCTLVNIKDIFLEAVEVQPWIKDYSESYMTKEKYLAFIESEDFDKAHETAYFSDGDYCYYPVSKFSRNWIEKQPFDFIVRSD